MNHYPQHEYEIKLEENTKKKSSVFFNFLLKRTITINLHSFFSAAEEHVIFKTSADCKNKAPSLKEEAGNWASAKMLPGNPSGKYQKDRLLP